MSFELEDYEEILYKPSEHIKLCIISCKKPKIIEQNQIPRLKYNLYTASCFNPDPFDDKTLKPWRNNKP